MLGIGDWGMGDGGWGDYQSTTHKSQSTTSAFYAKINDDGVVDFRVVGAAFDIESHAVQHDDGFVDNNLNITLRVQNNAGKRVEHRSKRNVLRDLQLVRLENHFQPTVDVLAFAVGQNRSFHRKGDVVVFMFRSHTLISANIVNNGTKRHDGLIIHDRCFR